ncbi:MAG: hypothetical protein JKX69_12585 [Rhodobacteraceae bacterium]|nr:hypothetical protein [Paracoccaceae bacterium]
MSLTKIIAAAAIATTFAGTVSAGGFADEIVEPIIVIDTASGFSLPAWVIPAALLAALVAVAATSSESDEGTAAE